MTLRQQSEPYPHPDLFRCDACGGWTEEMVTEAELLNECGWVASNAGAHRVWFCPDCQ